MRKKYSVAGHCFSIEGEKLCQAVDLIQGFAPFCIDSSSAESVGCAAEPTVGFSESVGCAAEPAFCFVEGEEVPDMQQVQYSFTYEDVTGKFGRYHQGYLLSLQPEGKEAFYLWIKDDDKCVQMKGLWELYLYRFAMWVGYGLMTLPYHTVAIHSSCIVYHDQAVLFLGESGTGKSTHTRLWRQHILGASLLNDDSPILRFEEGKIWAYGSPWSGKTPCYKAERHELKACVRLSQSPENRIKQLSVLQAYAAIHPSCPPEFAYDNRLYDHIGSFIHNLLSHTRFYHLSCLPDAAAAQLSCATIFQDFETLANTKTPAVNETHANTKTPAADETLANTETLS